MTVTTHLNFRGDARAALQFYQQVFGGQVTLVTYGDFHDSSAPAGHVIWGQVVAESGFRVMAYDVQSAKPWQPGENAFYVSVRSGSTDEIQSAWDKLSDGATITQPIAASAWAPLYGMLKDRFGVVWVLDVEAPVAH
jgi:PhnB protein